MRVVIKRIKPKKINLNSVIIPKDFDKNNIKKEKLESVRNQFLKDAKSLEHNVCVDDQNVLGDGFISYLVLKENGVTKIKGTLCKREFKPNVPRTYVFGVHHPDGKEYVWKTSRSTKNKDEIEPGKFALVSTKFGKKVIKVTRVETLFDPPCEGKIAHVYKLVDEPKWFGKNNSVSKNYVTYFDSENRFVEIFNKKTGFTLRTGVLDENGKDTGIDPFMRNYPQLIDVGVMGHCKHGKTGLCAKSGVQCYQSGATQIEPNMTIENFKRIVEECHGKTFQLALGGRGDVDQHENFEEILKCCVEHEIVPNFTSSGLGFNKEIVSLCKKYCGAVAISWYRNQYTLNAINMLLESGVKTNIHYVLGNNSIDEAIERLKNNSFPKGVNAIIFLLHKNVGQGTLWNVLKPNDERLKEFFELIDQNTFDFKIGFDSCTVPGILNFTKNINKNSLDSCEGGRFSMYITSDMKALPCSFDNQDMKWAYDISNDSIENAWKSQQFDEFRSHFKTSCMGCKNRLDCMGGCPICREIVLCNRKEKDLK